MILPGLILPYLIEMYESHPIPSLPWQMLHSHTIIINAMGKKKGHLQT